jgi:hypothetical protein
MSLSQAHRSDVAHAPTRAVRAALLAASFLMFLAELVDAAGRPLILAPHTLAWAELIAKEPRLVLLAPRSHGKTTLVLAYILWCFWRHAHDEGGRPLAMPAGLFQAVLFSATQPQALVLMAIFRDLLLANADLFGDVAAVFGDDRRRGARFSQTAVRLPSGAELLIRAYRTSTRGMHPDLLVLDDVLNDANSLTSRQREKTWRYLMSTLLPMSPGRMIVIGTAIHQADLLHQLGRGLGAGPDPHHTALGFHWVRYRALDEASGEALWPEVHSAAELYALRDADPLAFSREYQNEPRDDAASMFPYELTQRALDAGAGYTLGSGHPAGPEGCVVLGADFALSEAAGADYTVVMVVAYDLGTYCRRVLDIRREKGLDFAAQIELIRDLVVRHRVTLGVVEQNSFQRWIVDELNRWPETNGRIFGNTTGRGRADPRDGIPRLKLSLLAGSWVMPYGDAASVRLARARQTELGAFGSRNGRLEGVGEHDDMVVASWYVELAVERVEELRIQDDYEIVTAADLGIEHVRISPDLD